MTAAMDKAGLIGTGVGSEPATAFTRIKRTYERGEWTGDGFEGVSRASLGVARLSKGTTIPYVAHLMAVAAIVIECGGDEDQAIAALLHDAVEDQSGHDTLERIQARFGNHVGELVAACTDSYEQGPNKPDWKARKQQYLGSLASKPTDALLICAADKLHNATSILEDYRVHGEGLWSRFKGGRESLWYYRELVQGLRGRTDPRLHRRLEATVEELHHLAKKGDS